MSGKRQGSWLVLTFDVLFIMLLCFVTLLTTMLMRGSVIVGSDASMKYSFGLISFLLTFAGLGIYLFFILPHSKKELKKMITELYREES